MKMFRDLLGGAGIMLVVLALMAPVPLLAVEPTLPPPHCINDGETTCTAQSTGGCTPGSLVGTCGTREPYNAPVITCECVNNADPSVIGGLGCGCQGE